MTTADALVDAFGRIRGVVHHVAKGLTSEQLAFRPDAEANSIGWLLWHLTRIQDDHVAAVQDAEQVYISDGWVDRFNLPFEDSATGYGQSSDDVSAIKVESAQLLIGYHDAVYERTAGYVSGLRDADLGLIVDERFDPPVTLGARLVSVIADGLQHAGQQRSFEDWQSGARYLADVGRPAMPFGLDQARTERAPAHETLSEVVAAFTP